MKPSSTCYAPGCSAPVVSLGLCSAHYTRKLRHGTTDKPRTARARLIASGQSRCPDCRETKLLSEFNRDRSAPHGVSIYCRACNQRKGRAHYQNNRASHREYSLRRDFRIGVEDYDAQLAKQRGVCAICKSPPGDTRRLAVDHCHATGLIRGLLCQKCNHGLGQFRDNPFLLKRALQYMLNAQSTLSDAIAEWTGGEREPVTAITIPLAANDLARARFIAGLEAVVSGGRQ
jgi:hypothetical protein